MMINTHPEIIHSNYHPLWMEFRISRWNFIVLFLFLYSIGSAQKSNYWSPLPKPTPHTLDRVHFVDSLRGWITGQNGVLMYTSDGGQSWVQQISGITGEIPDIFMQNEKVGWAVAIQYPQDDTSWFGTNILHTTNGGMEWSVQRYDSVIFRTIFFQDSLTGFMGGSYGVIVKTTNGGQSWHKVSDSAQHKFPVYKIKFYSQNYRGTRSATAHSTNFRFIRLNSIHRIMVSLSADSWRLPALFGGLLMAVKHGDRRS